MQRVGVKGIHIAERDTQRATSEKPMDVFVNTWSVEGFVSEGMQPAELGWGTHEKWMPDKAGRQGDATRFRSIFCSRAPTRACAPGARRRDRNTASSSRTTSRSRSPISSRVRENGRAVYRPTCHYAYHPCNEAVLSLHEMFGQAGQVQDKHHILDEGEIVDGIDELGVLLYGHAKNAYWYGSQLSIEETRRIAPYQNATGLQVTSAVLAGMVWALENPKAGIVEADEIDFRRCLEVQTPYLGPVKGFYTDWTPLDGSPRLLPGGHRHVRSLAVPQRAGALNQRCHSGARRRAAPRMTYGLLRPCQRRRGLQPVRLRASASEAEQAPAHAADQQRQRPSPREAEAGGDDAFLRRRHRRLEIVVRRFEQIEVTVASGGPKALERTRFDKGLALPLEPLQALDIAAHGGALPADEIVRVGLEPVDGTLPIVAVGAGIRIEALHDPVQFVDGAAETLPILLREFRTLGGGNAPEQPQRRSHGTRDARHDAPSSIKTKPRRGSGSHIAIPPL